MIVDIPEPDQESRTAIVRTKCRMNNISLSDETVEFLASEIEDNIREIEVLLTSSPAKCNSKIRS